MYHVIRIYNRYTMWPGVYNRYTMWPWWCNWYTGDQWFTINILIYYVIRGIQRHTYDSRAYAPTSLHPFNDRPSTALKNDEANQVMETMLQELDSDKNTPDQVEPHIWERMCRLRRQKIESEHQVRLSCNLWLVGSEHEVRWYCNLWLVGSEHQVRYNLWSVPLVGKCISGNVISFQYAVNTK